MKPIPFGLLVAFLAITPLHFASSKTLPSTRPTKCHEHERSALLEFKQYFFHPELFLCWPGANVSKLESWKLEDGDCCYWEGIECDEGTGYVTSLDLVQSCLFGSINLNASLFRLTHLQSLHLNHNSLGSSIPSAIGDLVELTSLDLSFCGFTGQIPSQLLNLTNLSSLDLSFNLGLELANLSMDTMVQRLTKLEHLDLSHSNVRSSCLEAIANLSSLTSLVLQGCNLRGTIPTGIFELPRLQLLNLCSNSELSGNLPEFPLHGPIKLLSLCETNFSGPLPTSLGNLTFLREFDISSSCLSGNVPVEITFLTQLTYLDLSFNRLTGPIPEDISNLENLSSLHLQSNNLNGTLRLDVVLRLQHLTALLLSFNEFSSIIEPDMNASLPNLSVLGLASNNLSKLPMFIYNQSRLQWLDLSQNCIYGPTPLWYFNVSKADLYFLNFSGNLITSFPAFKWLNLMTLDLTYNDIQGFPPSPPKDISFYLISNNKLSGEISPEMCQLSNIIILDLSKNKLTGVIPPCLRNLSETLVVLSLHGNDLYGRFPQWQNDMCAFQMIDVSDNQLKGSLPRGLANCGSLKFLNFGNNQIVDTFPSWMGSLGDLNVLILRSNRFHGAIGEPEVGHQFLKLRIVDLSMNNFSSSLPYAYFNIWSAMKVHDSYDGYYYGYSVALYYPFFPDGEKLTRDDLEVRFHYSMTIINKGIAMEYKKILGYLNVIDLSSNNFIGEIPNSVGSLTELCLLNISNNNLTGPIPLSLANLIQLESLDLSSNKLSGIIPPALTHLIFLAFFNVSDNHLSGPIPQSNQFTTFENNSYGGNFGLCGGPLTKKCGNPVETPLAPPSSAFAEEDSGTWFEELDWKIVLIGFGGGLVIGVVMGLTTTSRIERWFLRFYRGRRGRRMHQIRFA